MAQALFQELKEEIFPELNYQAESAGIAAVEGTFPAKEAVFCLAKHGIDITTHRTQQVNSQLIKKSSLILTMTREQINFLKEHFPEARHKVFLLRLFCRQREYLKNDEIKDPYGESIFFYEDIYKQLKQDIKKLIFCLTEEQKNG
jgi:protein-tyrosine phosphatase